MIYLHKLLPLLLSPFLLLSVAIFIGLLRKNRRIIWIAMGVMMVISMPVVSNSLFAWLENNGSRKQPSDMQKADAIVVLSGMTHNIPTVKGTVSEWHDPDRFFGGIELIKSNLAPFIVFTKGRLPWRIGPTESEILTEKALQLGIDPQQILIAEDAENTAEEATQTSRLLNGKGKRIILVTSSYHMPRAKMVFENAGMEVQTYPVDFKTGGSKLVPMDFIPTPDGMVKVEKCVREALGRLFYSLQS